MVTTAGKEIQVENGNFSRIHNAILEAIYGGDFSLREIKCLLFLLRQTYGFQRKVDTISYEQFAAATGINRRHVISAMQSLVAKNVVTSTSNGTKRPQIWAFNKYIERWNLVTESVTSSTCVSSDQNSHQIDNLVTESVTTSSDQNSHQSSDQNSHPQKKERKERNISSPTPADEGKEPTEQQKWFNAVCVLVGLDYKVITKEQTGQVAQTVGKLRKADYSLDDLRAFWSYWKHDDWRGKQGQWPTLKQLLAEIGKVKMAGVTLGGEMSTNGNGGMMSPVFNGSEK